MLTEAERELVTTAVDGELPADRQPAFRRLVAESAAAFALYQELCRDRARLRDLPRVAAPPHLHAGVMARVSDPSRPTIPTAPTRQPVWLPVGLAASLLLLVGGASFLYFQSGENAARHAEQVQLLPKVVPHPGPGIDSGGGNTAVAAPALRELIPPPRPAHNEVARVSSPAVPSVEVAPPPRYAGGDDLLTSPVGPDGTPFSTVQVRVPLLLPVSELSGEDGRRRLAAELVREPAYRIDLFVNDPHRAAEALVAAAGKDVKLAVAIDATAGERLRKRLPFAWAVVVDSLTPAEVADWLAAARREAQSAPHPALTGNAHVVPASATEQKEWRELTGSEPAWAKPGRADAGPRPVSADTANQVAGAIQKSGISARLALFVTYLPREARVAAAVSKEVRLFADRPAERKAGTVPMMIVIRHSNP